MALLLAWHGSRTASAISLLWLAGLGTLAGAVRAEAPLRVPQPVPVRVADRLADAFKADAGDRVFFAEGSAALGTRARVALKAQAAWLMQHTSVGAVVEGYSDDLGGDEANLALAQARAETVRDRLAQLGVPEARLAIAAFGRSGQVVTCADVACAAPNRRVVIRIAVPQAAAAESPSDAGQPGVRPRLRRLF